MLPTEDFLPAGGQGIVALQIRHDDEQTKAIVDRVNDRETLLCLASGTGVSAIAQGRLRFAGGRAGQDENGKMEVRAQVFPDESPGPHEAEVEGGPEQGERLAAELLKQIRAE